MVVPARRVQRRVTLSEIAEACGVAPSTVSRALSNPNRVSPAMYERITSKAQEMGYTSALLPAADNRLARGTIALVVPNLTNPFNLDVIRGAQSQIRAASYLHLLVSTEESLPMEEQWLREMSRTVDGIVVSSPRIDDEVLRAVAQVVPTVVINRAAPGLSGVVIDTPAGLGQAVHYLNSLGHTRIAYVRGPHGSWTDRTRFDAISAAASERDIEIVAVGRYQPTLANGAAAADAVVLTHATACIFFNDVLAIGALDRFHQLGVSIPDDLSVVGCDDIFGSSFSHPPLTTVTSPGESAGRASVDMLIGRFATRDRSDRIDHISAHLTVRASTGPRRDG
ncbi:LacI family DNA-binding transcriptional regulator [Microbacterium capsulatum]|uniref:LacI family DNA-binding transcriptional regulator n=1 Tax=Microbacterium capsulatum TaxID=3041921 RepID=A0ABU0XJ44_9MICO|nr:LacI family DNA-binding transcriptional regulator [Microbacterium sp. ASV81]MDQ4215159.1 LacI family DNA-binding transcriptional regulator [Microbacterium sp. ASV81]